MFFDSHAHMTDDSMFDQIDAYLERAKEAGVYKIANICTDKVTLERGIALSERYNWVLNTGATTPHDVEEIGERDFSAFAKAAREGKLAAIGETGLDYHYEHSSKKVQKLFLERYLTLAQESNLPVIFHCRDAFDDLFAITEGMQSKAVLHCFTGTEKEALTAVKRGWMVSMSGIVTFKRLGALRETLKSIPLEHLLIETDAPYLAPQPMRGRRNEPSFVGETAKVIAEIKGTSLEEVAKVTSANAEAFFS